MAGLLYKDFVAVHGKIYVAVLSVITVLFAVFAVSPLPAASGYAAAIIVGGLVAMAALMLPMMVLGSIETGIIQTDEGAGKKAYVMSLPVSKRQYVASKYIFVLISYYVALSVSVIWAQFVNGCMEEALQDSFLMDAMGLTPLWIQVLLLASAIELPFFINVGVKAGNAIKTSILVVVFFAMFGYMLFGNMAVMDNISIAALIDWMEEHKIFTMALNVSGPVIAGGLYYLSYRIAASLFERRECRDEE